MSGSPDDYPTELSVRKRVTYQKDWHNFSPLDKGKYHRHLNYRYVACWTHSKEEILIEVYYVGSREKAHIELSIQDDHTDELISWLRKKYEVTMLTEGDVSGGIPIEKTDFWKETRSNRVGNLLVAARHKSGITQKLDTL